MFAATYSRLGLPLNGASAAFAPCRFDADLSAGSCAAADVVPALSFDLDRAGGSAGTAGGVAEELRPRMGLLLGAGATTTASGCSGGLDPALSRFGVGPEPTFDVGAGVGPAAALDELDAAPGVREALLLLALAFAVGGCAEGTRLAA